MRRSIGVIFAGAAFAWGAAGAPVAVPNFSFESPDAHTPFGVSTKINNWTTYGDFPFDTGGGASSSGTGIFPNVNPDNSVNFDNANQTQVAYVFSKSGSGQPKVGLEQILTTTFEAGEAYALRLDVGLAGSNPGATEPLTFDLFYFDPANPSARTPVASRTIHNDGTLPLSKTHLTELVVTSPVLAAGNAAVGKQIGIEIFTADITDASAVAGRQYDFDNVRVDTPEPASCGALAVVALATLGRRVRRRSAAPANRGR